MDLRRWLRSLGLEQYEAAFRENEIDDAVLPSLTAEDLKDLGISIVGHRRKLLDAIAALRLDASATTGPAVGHQPPDRAERRHVTVVFSDLVGSTALSSRLDPEDLREIIGGYHRCCAERITKAGGFVAKYMGDGVLAYFGYPQAHEDDAERAVNGALSLIEAVPTLRTQHNVALQVRVGIASGVVVVGDLIGEGAAQEQGVVGETPNLAARLQSLAEPGQVLISQSTRRATGGLFEYVDLGRVMLKGLAESVPVWQVLGASRVESRFEAQHEAALAPLVGRQEELELLLRRWRQSVSGEGRVVLLSGEPGIGKSRLVVALEESLQRTPHIRMRYFCSPQHTDSAFYPIVSQLERAARLERQDEPRTKLAKLKGLVEHSRGDTGDLELLAELLSIPSDQLYAPVEMSPQRKKEMTIEALLRQLEALTHNQPVLMIFEDVHWIDPSSRDILDLTVERVASLPILLIITFRPEFQPSWIGQPHVTIINLNRLSRRDGAALVGSVAGSRLLSPEITAEIVERTDGIPLFAEELTKAVIEAEAQAGGDNAVLANAPLAALSVPASLHTSLMARLDRLGAAAKETAQIGAVIGREFLHLILVSVSEKSETDLRSALAKLMEAGLVFRRGVPPDATYLFKHALVRDAAYGSLLRPQRQLLHDRVVFVIEGQFPELVVAQPELLAQHCAEAGLVERAVGYWLRAGQQAMARSAMLEAIAQLTKGLELVSRLPVDRHSRQSELDLRTTLGTALTAVKGYAASETGETYTTARKLCEELGDTPAFARVGYGQYLFHLIRGEVQRSHEVALEILNFAEKAGSEEALILGNRVLGVTLFEQGQCGAARERMKVAWTLLDRSEAQPGHAARGRDARVMIPTWETTIASWQGFLDQAYEARERALAEAQASSLHSRIFAQCFGANCLIIRGDYRRAVEESDAICSLAGELGFPYFLACGLMLKGTAKSGLGHEDSISLFERGIQLYRSTGAKWALTQWLSAFANAPGQRIDAARAILEEGFAVVNETGERWNEAELYRLRGKLSLSASASDDRAAEADFLLARQIAAKQGAKLLELRASTNLARLWRDQGKRGEAHDLLAPIYRWFAEGFDTPDLKESKALLDGLTSEC